VEKEANTANHDDGATVDHCCGVPQTVEHCVPVRTPVQVFLAHAGEHDHHVVRAQAEHHGEEKQRGDAVHRARPDEAAARFGGRHMAMTDR